MADYNEVYANSIQDLVETQVEFAYLTIPAKYVGIYHKLLVAVADFGKTLIDDCTSACKGYGKNVLNCWNLFQSAMACYSLDRNKEADFFIDYIEKQLTNIYKGTDVTEYVKFGKVKITEDGRLTALVSCGEEPKFFVDRETGQLLEEIDISHKKRLYVLSKNGNLEAEINSK